MLVAWIVAIGLILVNAFYVAAEFATVAARTAHIGKLASDGNRLASALLAILEKPAMLDKYIATCQIGITFSSLVLGAFSQINFGPIWSQALVSHFQLEPALADSVAAAVILTVFTVLQILLGELLPKSVSLQYSERVALLMYWPLRVSSTIFHPFIWVLNGSGNFLLKAFGVPASSHKHIHSLEEIELLLAESKDGGLLEPEEHNRLHQALELSEKTARQLMTPRSKIFAASAQTSLQDCYKLALQSPYTRMLVYGESIDDVIGIVNLKDVIQAQLSDSAASIKSLVRPVPIVPENLTLGRLIALLKVEHSHVAIVMDEFGSTRGIVTAGDVLAELMQDVEVDEFKQPEMFEVLADGRIRLPGSYKLHRLSKLLGNVPDSEAETINGLLVYVLERLPVVGDIVEFEDVILQVDAVERNAASFLTLSRKSRPGQ